MPQYTFEQKVNIVKRRLGGEELPDIGIQSRRFYAWEHTERILKAAADELGISYEVAVGRRNTMSQERILANRRRMNRDSGKFFYR